MANEFDDFDDDLLDEETLLALDQAEKQHAVAITASQALPAASNSHRAATVPVKPFPQRQPNINARAPQASQQQRAASARPIHQQQVARAVPPSQQQQRQQYALPQQQAIKTDPPHQYGNAAAGPSTSTYARKVVKPVYRDDFPNVDIDESGHRYKPRNSSVHAHSTSVNTSATNGVASRPGTDAEKEELKRQLASLQASLEQEHKDRLRKDGEVSYLRQITEKLSKDHEIALQEQIKKVLPLQERILNLESTLDQENARHSSALIFQKQELESKYRNVATSIKNASARKQQHQQQSQTNVRSSQVAAGGIQSSPRRPFKVQKGFQNSFFEPMTSTQRVDNGGRLPSSPSDGRAGPIQRVSSPANRDKGKQREIEPSSEMDYNDLPELQQEAFEAGYENDEDNIHQQGVQANTLSSLREEIISFLFDHIPHKISHITLSLFSLVNPDFPTDFEAHRISNHREICQRLFHCFGHRSESSQQDKQQITLSIWEIFNVLLDFVEFYSLEEAFRSRVIVAIDLIQDLCQRYATLALSEDSNPTEYETITGKMFRIITTCIKNECTRIKLLDMPPAQPQATAIVRSRSMAPNPRSRQAKIEAEKARFEKEVEDVLCSILHLLQFLALRPDPTRLAHLDAFLRESNSLAFLMDARRRPVVHLEAMFLVVLLSGQQVLFRSLLSTSFQDEPPVDLNLRNSTAAGRTQQLAFVEQTAGFLSYRIGTKAQSQACQQLALISLSNLVFVHSDGTPLLSRSPSLIQRLIMRIAQDAAVLYDSVSMPPMSLDLDILLRIVEASMRLLHHLVLSQDGLKSLSTHLSERPFGRDYFVSGVGRLACTEVPEWIKSAPLASQLDQLANLGFELLEDVLSPDEVDDLYSLCRDEDDEEDNVNNEKPQQANERDEEEEMAAQNIDAMEL